MQFALEEINIFWMKRKKKKKMDISLSLFFLLFSFVNLKYNISAMWKSVLR